MDALALKIEKVKVLTVKLEHAEKKISELLSEKVVMKSCVADVNALLSDIIETRDFMITITVKKHLAEKLRPVFAMLNRLEGISRSSSLLKQGGETMKKSKKEIPKPIEKPTTKPKSENKPMDNVASDSKGKENLNNEPIIDDSNEEEPDEHELKRKKTRQARINEHNRIVREAEEKERAKREAQVRMESRKLLFPLWTLDRMMSAIIDLPS
ncbi:unnamed protein product [Lactuca saligna]|uniref:Uncharacterized protein n=1 Tax=Lactuca saligna TaxID=75948 RepID=A0AA35Y919_LACSI|nr:unnamed protein product [Lactuca saligna]